MNKPYWEKIERIAKERKIAAEQRAIRLVAWREHLKQLREHSTPEEYEKAVQKFRKEFPNEQEN